MSRVTIRPARAGDYESICRLAEQMDSLFRRALPDRFRRPRGPARQRDYILGLIADPDTFLAVAELEGRVVGVVNTGIEQTPDMPVKKRRIFLRVRGIIVDHAHRRQGIATRLTRAAEKWARGRRAVEVQLNVYDFDEPARRLCEKLGYLPLSHRLVRPLLPSSGRRSTGRRAACRRG